MKEPANKVEKNAVAVVRSNPEKDIIVKKIWLALCNRNLHDCINVSVPAPLRFGRIFNRETRQS